MHKLLQYGLGVLLMCTLLGATGVVWKTTPDELEQAIKKPNKLVLLEISTTWCSGCKQIYKSFQDPNVVELANKFVCIRIDADKYPKIEQIYMVRNYPTLIFFKDSKELRRIIGGMDAYSLELTLQDVLEKYGDK